MNLLFFSVEVERSRSDDWALRGRAQNPRVKAGRRGLQLAVVIAVFICAVATTLMGWVLVRGDEGPLLWAVPDWVPFSMTSASGASGATARIDITSNPSNATATIDGRKMGQTPLSLMLESGPHLLGLSEPDATDYQRHITVDGGGQLHVNMLLRRPIATQLKPPYPGTSINDAEFLADGRLALSVAERTPAGDATSRALNEPWIFDPAAGTLHPFQSISSPGAAIVAVSPDATRLALAQPRHGEVPAGSGRQHLAEVLVQRADGSAAATVFAIPAATGAPATTELEEVQDVAWTPGGNHLLVTLRLYSVGGSSPAASRSRVLLVDADSANNEHAGPLELVTLPAEIVPGSYNWAADGHWVAFLTRAAGGSGTSFVALCALDTTFGGAASGFRYVADLARQSGGTGSLPPAPVAWFPTMDGRLVYAAPTPKLTVGNPLGLPMTSGGEPGLFMVTPSTPGLTAEEGHRLGSVTGLIAPTWSTGGETGEPGVMALARTSQGSKSLAVRVIDPETGTVRNLDVVLPGGVGGAAAASARWDLAHGQLLVLAPHDTSSSGLLDYWVVQLGAERDR